MSLTLGACIRKFAQGLFTAVLLASTSACQRETSNAASSKNRSFESRNIEVFVGAASKPATEDAVARFEKKTGAKLEVHFGGSGMMLSQMKLSGRGDIYFPGSSDYMELAKKEGVVDASSEQRVVYLVPAINVQRGNPRGIKGLDDLGKPGIRVGIARPDTVCVGLYAVELLETTKMTERVKPNIVTHAESCEKAAQLVSLQSVDAVLGWRVFEHWDEEKIETVSLPREQVTRIGYIPIAIGRSARDPELAGAFILFLMSPEGQAIFEKWGYLASAEEAREKYALPTTPVGGEWTLPDVWTR
jgi:molybdate transport system substrate-binding protein